MIQTNGIRVSKMDERAIVPRRATDGAAGFDLHAVEATVVPARGRALVPVGLAFEIPRGMYGRIAPRSGLALRHGIDVGAGVVDSDYRGAVGVVLFNHGDAPVDLAQGERVAQIIFTPCPPIELEETSAIGATTARGSGGFGSTGA